ncbi:MAG: phosphoribosyltransferase family protein [Marinobacter sp.]|nr:phosphoribosyltransferase family protein [Marinobacter sp.]
MISHLFKDRNAAGQALVRELKERHLPNDALVLGLPRGGIPVAWEIARAFDLELDALNLRKLGVPTHPEVAMGAIAEDGTRYLDSELVFRLGITPEQIEKVEEMERRVLASRIDRFRNVRPAARIGGRTVIVVDDGIATGATMELAARVLRRRGAEKIIVAVPVGPEGTAARFSNIADDCICLLEPKVFNSVGLWYQDFHQVPEDRVIELLQDALDHHRSRSS